MSRWPLVGRNGEVEGFQESLTNPACDTCVIYGAAGVGKTRLADEFLELAAQRGHVCRRVSASDAARTVPLGVIAHLLPPDTDVSDPFALLHRTIQQLGSEPQAGERPVWFVDDLHFLDDTSAAMIGQLLDAGAVFLLGTVRSGAPLSEAVAGLDRGDRTRSFELRAWTLREVETVLSTVLDGSVEHGTALQLHHHSGGNALFLKELVHGALESGVLIGAGGLWRLSGPITSTQHLDETIRRRIGSVSPDGRAILDHIAVCGPMSGDRRAENVLEELEQLGLIHVRADGRRLVVELAHPLYGTVLRSGLGGMHKRRLLMESAHELERAGGRRREDALKAAMWSLDATGTADPGRLQRALQLARHAQDTASVARLAQALSRLDPGAGPRMLHGEALYELGQFDAADHVLREAMEAARNDEEFILATILRTQSLTFGRMQLDKALAVAQDGQARLRQTQMQQALRVFEAGVHVFAGRTARALELVDDLETMPDPRLRVMGALSKIYSLAQAGRNADALALSESSYQEHLGLPETFSMANPRMQLLVRAEILYRQGHLDEARHLAENTYAQAAEGRALIAQAWLGTTLGDLEYSAGRLHKARSWYATTAALAADHHFAAARWLSLTRMAQVTAAMGDVDASDAYRKEAQRLEPMGHQRGEPIAVTGWRFAAVGNLRAACDALLEAADITHQGGMYGFEANCLSDAARLGGASRIHRRLAGLAAQSDNPLTGLQAEHANALHHHDPEHLLHVAGQFEKTGLLPAATHSYSVAAEFLSSRGEHRSATAAGAHAARLTARCQGVDVALPVDASPIPLTTRENEIALLAAQGHSNREIADRLHLSARTVGNHLYSIYRKLGAANRRQLREALSASQP
ncbi:LuxR C-terminal-related transcriptional regulator [Streptomyces sp. NPDC051776]|uniref:helix-turn-helix transcriptional regulator n=1 Tax=Streptomyces sp. NPDC051776 TaxID=3155414 RepID=UPI0034499AEC